jgi:hypothetical protein
MLKRLLAQQFRGSPFCTLKRGSQKERKMTQTRSRVWVEVFAVVVTLALGGMLLYALLPFLTAPDQQVVPPPQQMDLGQMLLTLFIAATAIGAPLTVGIVLVLLAKFVSRRVPASSSVAPEIPSPKAKPRAVEQSAEMSARAALIWKIVATVLLLIVAAGVLAGLAVTFAQFYQ